ncbi:MAG: phosphotransferase family protein, partial [Planctomycetes bacterium]|nr:phosphotransferase family protein [Planctomycetota bacterium]
ELSKLDYNKIGLSDFGKVDGFLDRQVGRWINHLEAYSKFEGYSGPDIPGLDEVTTWLNGNIPPKWQAGIIHGDYHLANVIFENDSAEVAAAVDWELSTIGDPLVDLGWLMATWPGDDGITPIGLKIAPWSGFADIAQLVEHYGKVNDRDLSHINWYAVLACFKMGIILEGTHARACAGKAPVAFGDMLHGMTISLFERALNWLD